MSLLTLTLAALVERDDMNREAPFMIAMAVITSLFQSGEHAQNQGHRYSIVSMRMFKSHQKRDFKPMSITEIRMSIN